MVNSRRIRYSRLFWRYGDPALVMHPFGALIQRRVRQLHQRNRWAIWVASGSMVSTLPDTDWTYPTSPTPHRRATLVRVGRAGHFRSERNHRCGARCEQAIPCGVQTIQNGLKPVFGLSALLSPHMSPVRIARIYFEPYPVHPSGRDVTAEVVNQHKHWELFGENLLSWVQVFRTFFQV